MRSLITSRLRFALVKRRLDFSLRHKLSLSTTLNAEGKAQSFVDVTKTNSKSSHDITSGKTTAEVSSACNVTDDNDDDDDDMEQEEMFVEAHESFEHKMVEWGGPRRGGRLPEPTRFGDWERKGRCTDF